MSLESFHPVIQKWFTDTLGTPTAAQRDGWAAIREGRAQARRGEFATDEEMAAFFKKRGS